MQDETFDDDILLTDLAKTVGKERNEKQRENEKPKKKKTVENQGDDPFLALMSQSLSVMQTLVEDNRASQGQLKQLIYKF